MKTVKLKAQQGYSLLGPSFSSAKNHHCAQQFWIKNLGKLEKLLILLIGQKLADNAGKSS